MIESLKGFSRFTKEAVEEGSNQELDSIKEGFPKSLNGDEDDKEKEWAISKYTDVRKPRNPQLFCTVFLLSIHRYCMIRKNKVMENMMSALKKQWEDHKPSTNPKPR